MHFIQNHELREWVKESLRKAIFQKAHALATQTGCEILIKLQDDGATNNKTNHQYYATKVLRQAYHTNRVRMHPDDKLVSGETGMPVVSKGLQIGDGMEDNPEELLTSNKMVEDQYDEHYLSNGDVITQTSMQVDEETEHSRTEKGVSRDLESEICPSTSTLNDTIPEVRIKVEKLDNDEDGECSTSFQGISNEKLSESSLPSLPRSTISINPKPYQCAVCHKAFRSVQVLQKHTQTFHVRPRGPGMLRGGSRGGLVPNRLPPPERFQDLAMPPGVPPDFKGFYCIMCNQDFPNSTALQDHMTLSHMDIHQASESSSSIDQKPSITTPSSAANKSLFISPPDPGPAPPTSVPMFMTLPSSPGAPFSQSSPSGPVFSHPGLPVGFSRPSLSSSGRSKARTYTKRLMGKQLNDRNIMSAILQTAGPVATHFTVLTASPNFILGSTYITKEQFVAAAGALEDLNLGSLVTVRHVHGRPSVNFVKKRPEDVKELLELETNADLCNPSLYEEMFKKATPACVPQGTREKLISLGLVAREDIK